MADNLKSGPLFLTPQVIRGLQGIGHAKRMINVPLRRDIKLSDHCPASKIFPRGKVAG